LLVVFAGIGVVVGTLSGAVVVVAKVTPIDEFECEPQAIKSKKTGIRKKILMKIRIFSKGLSLSVFSLEHQCGLPVRNINKT